MSNQRVKNLASIQSAADQLVNSKARGREQAFQQLATSILKHYDGDCRGDSATTLFSLELPPEIQRFSAAWLLRVLSRSDVALDFGDFRRLTATLFDRTMHRDVYQTLKIEEKEQTFKKLQILTDYAAGVIQKARTLVEDTGNLYRLDKKHQDFRRLINDRRTRPFLLPFFPRHLVKPERVALLFDSVSTYVNDTEGDPIITRDAALEACVDFERDARNYGTSDADEILGGMARQLQSAIMNHFASSEENEPPLPVFTPTEKKYPLEQPGAEIIYKVKIANDGSGPIRDIRLEEIVLDPPLKVKSAPTALGTIQSDKSIIIDIAAIVLKPCSQAKLMAEFSWVKPGERLTQVVEFEIAAQKADVDWEGVEESSPYSLEAVTTGDELIGRKAELKSLLRLANLKTVGSAFIYGQKRVGKTSLANALAESLESRKDANWIVISKGSGDYIGDDAKSTLQNLGEVLVRAMKERIHALANLSQPDFTNGLSPLSSVIDNALMEKDLRLLFILDEFDELPLELLRRTDISTALFQPLRESSNKAGCGFLLVGGERMRSVLNIQGERLNKFKSVQVNYFDRSKDWSDFVELIRKPVQDWMAISDAALDKLFACSAGNPYFAKLLANQLFEDMVSLRHCDASEDDMNTAFANASTTV